MRLLHHYGKTVIIIIAILFFSLDLSYAQTSVEAGFSVGFNRHTFSTEDESGILQPGLALAGTYGFPVVIKKNSWELHTGFYGNDLSQSYYFNVPGGATYGKRAFSNGISTYKIPFRVGRTLVWTNKASLSPQIGFSWLTSQRTGPTGMGSGSYGSTVEYNFETQAINKNKFMAEAGMDLNISVFRTLILSLGAQYSLGLQSVEKIDVSYQVNDQTYEGTVYSKGTGWKFNIGLKFPFVN